MPRYSLRTLIVLMLLGGPMFFVAARPAFAGELDATWIVESFNGSKEPVYQRAFNVGEEVIIDGNSISFGRTKRELWFKLDATQTPSQFDFAGVAKGMPLKQFSCRGSWRLEDDKLVLCGAEPIYVGRRPDVEDSGWVLGDRPTEFKATDSAFLVVLKRKAK